MRTRTQNNTKYVKHQSLAWQILSDAGWATEYIAKTGICKMVICNSGDER